MKDTSFRIGVSFDAAAAAPVRHQTIKDALLDRARTIMAEAEGAPSFDWEARGFRRAEGRWTRDYAIEDIADLLAE